MRIWAALAAAVLLVLEALAFTWFGLVVGLAVKHQRMSMGGLSTDSMAVGAWVALGLLALFVLIVAVLAARMALRRGAMGRPTRILLIVCAVLHAVLAAVLLALSGVAAFVWMLVTVTLMVLLLSTTTEPEPPAEPESTPGPEPLPGPGVEPKPAL
jgi:hypothetical protein